MTEGTTGGVASDRGGRGRRVRYERSEDEPASVATATALARLNGEDVTSSSTRLYEHVDPEALDALFAATYGGVERSPGRIQFDAGDALVVVRADCVQVYPAR